MAKKHTLLLKQKDYNIIYENNLSPIFRIESSMTFSKHTDIPTGDQMLLGVTRMVGPSRIVDISNPTSSLCKFSYESTVKNDTVTCVFNIFESSKGTITDNITYDNIYNLNSGKLELTLGDKAGGQRQLSVQNNSFAVVKGKTKLVYGAEVGNNSVLSFFLTPVPYTFTAPKGITYKMKDAYKVFNLCHQLTSIIDWQQEVVLGEGKYAPLKQYFKYKPLVNQIILSTPEKFGSPAEAKSLVSKIQNFADQNFFHLAGVCKNVETFASVFKIIPSEIVKFLYIDKYGTIKSFDNAEAEFSSNATPIVNTIGGTDDLASSFDIF